MICNLRPRPATHCREGTLDRIQEMTVFVAVTDERSFAAAARRLKVSAATITRAVAELERRLGSLLIVRNTRQLRLTEAGERFAADSRRLLQELQEAEESAAGIHASPKGLLVVTALFFTVWKSFHLGC